MTLRSGPGAGRRFTIVLPGSRHAAAAEAASTAVRSGGTRGRVLVVDDDESVRSVFARLPRSREFALLDRVTTSARP